VAAKLARIGGFSLRIKSESSLPPDCPEGCKRSISLALLWQAGYMETTKHKAFLSQGGSLDGGTVNIMGQHGEIGRSYYARLIRATGLSEAEYEDRLVSRLIKKMPPFLSEGFRCHVRDVIIEAYRQADDFGLESLARLDFFYLFERTRRWASGSLAAQPGQVIAPFLNPDFVRAAFACGDKLDHPLHRHIVAVHAPDWATVPYASALPKVKLSWAQPGGDWKASHNNQNYSSQLYWKAVGPALVRDALSRGGLWTDFFDPDLVSKQWLTAPEPLAIVSLLGDVIMA
jgi:hypothetical protein